MTSPLIVGVQSFLLVLLQFILIGCDFELLTNKHPRSFDAKGLHLDELSASDDSHNGSTFDR